MLFGWTKKPTSEVKTFKKLSVDVQREMLKNYVKKN
jgi:hypothetical protein